MSVDSAEYLLFAGNSNLGLAQEIAHYLNDKLSPIAYENFPDGEIALQIQENVRGRDVFIVQSVALQPNEFLMELLIAVDALRRAAAKSITAVIPYFGYARQDRKDKPRVPITAKLVANLLVNAGVNHVLTVDFHADQVQGFFDIPVDNLYGRLVMADTIKKSGLRDFIVVAPDIGSVKLVRGYAKALGVDFAVVDKHRISASQVEAYTVIGDVKGKNILLADDMVSTAGTLVSAAKACQEKGAQQIFAVATHGLLVGDAVERIQQSPIEALYYSNTIPHTDRLNGFSKGHQVSVAPLLAQAIRCILAKESISSMKLSAHQ